MDQERRQRYRDKLAHADRRLQQVDAWRSEVERSEVHRLARYKAFQEAAEAATDLAAMVLHDLGQPVRDDYRNLESLSEAGTSPWPPFAVSTRRSACGTASYTNTTGWTSLRRSRPWPAWGASSGSSWRRWSGG